MKDKVNSPPLLRHEPNFQKMPAYQLLASIGKRVLRPGGLGVTKRLLDDLTIKSADVVVEFAPGLGQTALLILAREPRLYVGIERDIETAREAAKRLPASDNIRINVGRAEETGLPDASTDVVLGEAMLTMNPMEHKRAIVAEAFRLLRHGGRYGLHELAIASHQNRDADRIKQDVEVALSDVLHIGARPLTAAEWTTLLTEAGFIHIKFRSAKMRLLDPARVVADEGLAATIMIVKNLLLNPTARRRVIAIRRVLHQHRDNLQAIAITATKV